MINIIRSGLLEASVAFVIALDMLVKSLIVLGISFAIHYGLGRSRALARSALWQATLMGLIVLPLVTLAFPRLSVGVLPIAGRASPGESTRLMSESVPSRGVSDVSVIGAESLGLLTVQSAVSTGVDEPSNTGSISVNRLGIGSLVIGLYTLVVVLLTIKLLAALAAVRDLRRGCLPIAAQNWNRALARSCEALGISRRIVLLESDRISIPMVVGWFHPAVIIPRSLLRSAGPDLIAAVLLHELAHIRRNDFAWNLAYKIVRLIYWPNPLIWPAGRLIGALREQACDDLCIHALGGASAYRESLLEVAAGLVRRPELSLGLALARATNLARRLAWIDVSQGKPQCVLSRPARIGMAFLVVVVTGIVGSIEAEQQRTADAPKAPTAFELTVMAKDTHKLLPGAKASFVTDFHRTIRKAGTDGVIRHDRAEWALQDSLGFDVWAEGYVQQRFTFAQNDALYPKIPTRFSVELLPGEQTLGGKVTDEAGRPIAGVTVRVWGYLGEKKDERELACDVDATTDEDGHWRCRCFRVMKFAYLYLSHPDYVSDNDGHPRRQGYPAPDEEPLPGDQPFAGLRDFSNVQVMKTGVSLAGKIVDGENKPIVGATVCWMRADEKQPSRGGMPVVRSDDAGRFRFAHVRPGPQAVQVTAAGFAPELKVLDEIDIEGHLTITLGAPRSFSGRVLDMQGTPIPGVLVGVGKWRGYAGTLGVCIKSDEDGQFRWNDAPLDEFAFTMSRTGFMTLADCRVPPGLERTSLVLRRAFSISGRIKDADTDEPVGYTEVEIGVSDAATGEFVWRRERNIFASQSRLHGDINVENRPEFRLRFMASGYEPFVSRVFSREESQVEYDVRLKKAQ